MPPPGKKRRAKRVPQMCSCVGRLNLGRNLRPFRKDAFVESKQGNAVADSESQMEREREREREREYEAVEAGEVESRCSSRAGDNAARGSHFNKHTVAARAGGSHQRCSFPRQPPPLITHTHKHPHTHTHTHTHTHIHTHHHYHHSDSAFTHPRPTAVSSLACQSCSRSPPRRSCVT